MKVIFLDVDGVLNDQMWLRLYENGEIDKERVARLAEIVKATGAVIVLSSSWRVLPDELDDMDKWVWRQLVDALHEYGMSIHDRTPVIGMDRPLEIRTWLDQHKGQVEAFVSLDDDYQKTAYDEYGIGYGLVKTSFYGEEGNLGGLQDRHVQKAIEILGGRINED
jgi:hypothetical protein